LTGWGIADNHGIDYIASLQLPPGGFAVIAAGADFYDNFPDFNGDIVFIADGSIGNGLNNGGDRLVLTDPTGKIIDALSYGDDATMMSPPCQDVAEGHSLERQPAGLDTDQASDFVDNETPSPGYGLESATPTPTSTPTPTTTPTPTPTPTPTVSPSPTPATMPTPTVTPSPTVTLTPMPTPTPTPTPTPASTLELAATLIDLSGAIDENGVLQQDVECSSADGTLKLEISSGTTALTGEGDPLQALELQPVDDPPAPPTDCHVIGLAFDLRPDDATFAPPLILTIEYDPASCPKGITKEDLVIAYFDVVRQEWVLLPSTVDTENNTVTAQVSHFTIFAILAKAPTVAWWLVGATIAGSIAVGLLVVFLVIARQRRPPTQVAPSETDGGS